MVEREIGNFLPLGGILPHCEGLDPQETGQMDVCWFARTDGQKFPLLFYRTSSPLGPLPKKEKERWRKHEGERMQEEEGKREGKRKSEKERERERGRKNEIEIKRKQDHGGQ